MARVDPAEVRLRQAEMRLAQLHHQVGLRHSDLQRRFVFALTLIAGVFLLLLRAEVPLRVGALAAALPAMWAVVELRRINRLAEITDAGSNQIIGDLDGLVQLPQGSRGGRDNQA